MVVGKVGIRAGDREFGETPKRLSDGELSGGGEIREYGGSWERGMVVADEKSQRNRERRSEIGRDLWRLAMGVGRVGKIGE